VLAGQCAIDLRLKFSNLRVSGVNGSPLGKSFVDVGKRIERIDGQYFRISGDRFQHNPRIWHLQIRASACCARERLAAFSRFIEPESLINEHYELWGSRLRLYGTICLAGCTASAHQHECGNHHYIMGNCHYAKASSKNYRDAWLIVDQPLTIE
jgi:hypothetical protein